MKMPERSTVVLLGLCLYLGISNGQNGNFLLGIESLINQLSRSQNGTSPLQQIVSQLFQPQRSNGTALSIGQIISTLLPQQGNNGTTPDLSRIIAQLQQRYDTNNTDVEQLLELLSKTSTARFVENAIKYAISEFEKQAQGQTQTTPVEVFNIISALTNSYAGIQETLKFTTAYVSGTVSDKCLKAVSSVADGIGSGKFWALKMVDAMGKPGSSILRGQLIWVGSYTECIDIKAKEIEEAADANDTDISLFNGQFCTSATPLGPGATIGMGLCFPDVCNQTEKEILLRSGVNAIASIVQTLQGKNSSYIHSLVFCQEPDREFDDKAKAALVVVGVFVLLVTIGTIFDCVLRLIPEENDDDSTVFKTPGGAVVVDEDNKAMNSKGVNEAYIEHGDVELSSVKMNGGSVTLENGHVTEQGTDIAANDGENSDITHVNSTANLTDDADKKPTKKQTRGVFATLLMSMSAYSSGVKILWTKQAPGALECVNGIRFLSMAWVILGHTIALTPYGLGLVGNMPDVGKYITHWSFMAIFNATVSVDTFFVLSGLLVTYLALKTMKKKNGFGPMDWALFYFHRYWRLTPPYLLVMMVYYCLSPYFGSGPFWNATRDENCDNNWWTNVLYLNNIVHVSKQCMAWSWYLANDMQFYVFSPLLLYPLFKLPVFGLAFTAVLAFASVVVRGVQSHAYTIGPSGNLPVQGEEFSPHSWDKLYVVPWTRASAYMVGVIVGYILYKTKLKVKMHFIIPLIGWIIAAHISIATLYGVYEPMNGNSWNNDMSAVYNALFRFSWSVAVGWVIFACCTGYGGWINELLSWRGFVPLSRLTYCVYLVHPIIMTIFYNSQQTLIMMTMVNLIFYFLAFMVASYATAFVVSLLFEAPMLGVEKALLGRFK